MMYYTAFERTKPQLEEMVKLGGLKVKKIHATRYDVRPPMTPPFA